MWQRVIVVKRSRFGEACARERRINRRRASRCSACRVLCRACLGENQKKTSAARNRTMMPPYTQSTPPVVKLPRPAPNDSQAGSGIPSLPMVSRKRVGPMLGWVGENTASRWVSLVCLLMWFAVLASGASRGRPGTSSTAGARATCSMFFFGCSQGFRSLLFSHV